MGKHGCGGGSDVQLNLQVRAASTEASNGATASVTQNLTIIVLSGTATTTPVGVNPYVNLNPGSVSTATNNPSSPSDPIVLVGVPLVDATGTLQITAAPASGTRTWEEEEAADAQRAKALQDEWLRELEAAVATMWTQH
jgi:hypothetical protein